MWQTNPSYVGTNTMACRLFIYMSDNFNAILEISTLLFFLLQVFRHTLKKEHFSTVNYIIK